MITIKPFKGYRPKKEFYKDVVSQPYDVLTREEYREIAEKNPKSYIHIVRPEVDCPPDASMYSEDVYNKGKENLNLFIEKGYLVEDEKPSFYIYKQVMGSHSQVGFIGGISIYDYDQNRVKKHEKTRQDKEDDRIKHIETLNAHTGPSFLVYKSKESLDSILLEKIKAAPEVSITTEDNIVHELWKIDDQSTIDTIVAEFKKLDCLYIADGHHRSKASAAVGLKRDKTENSKDACPSNAAQRNDQGKEENEYKYMMAVIFPDNMLKILAYNRSVADLNGLSKEEFLDKVTGAFEVKEVPSNDETGGFKPASPTKIGMYLDGKWYELTAKADYINSDPVDSLDVAILQDNVLSPLLGVTDPRKDKRINFIGGMRGTDYLKNLVDSGKYAVAFSMYPTTMEQLLDVADANKLMPPKSTWFEPKLRSGMVTHMLD